MANVLDLVKEVDKLNVYQDTADKLKQGEFTPEELKASYLLEDKAIKAESKIPKTILEVFGEKSKDGDELVSSTLQSIANMKRGELEDILYKVSTEGGDERYIHRSVYGLPTQERREWDANILRGDIESNPSYSDTISYKKGMERLSPQKGVLSKLAKLLGL